MLRPGSSLRWLSASLTLLAGSPVVSVSAAEAVSFDKWKDAYQAEVRPLLERYCIGCHSTESKEGELDLERLGNWTEVRRDPSVWQQVQQMLRDGEMPPADSPQLPQEGRERLNEWLSGYLDAEARAAAGDPGPVVLRRLNNAEYRYTIQDLTGTRLDPTREFPADGAAGEGFRNTGQALAMSPSLVDKYLAAAKDISRHLVLLPDGIRFSEGTTRRDWTGEMVNRIRRLYQRHTSGDADVSVLDRWSVADPRTALESDGRVDLAAYFAALVEHRERFTRDRNAAEGIAAERGLNARYLRYLADLLLTETPPGLLMARVAERCRTASEDDVPALAAEVRAWQDELWTFNKVGHFGSIRPWQQAATPLVPSADFRLKFEPAGSSGTVTLRLASRALGQPEDGTAVQWRSARIEWPGEAPLPLRDVRTYVMALRTKRDEVFSATTRYLDAACEVRQAPGQVDLGTLSARYRLDPSILEAWVRYLGLSAQGPVEIPPDNYLRQPLRDVGGYAFVKGWTQPGASALSIIANPTDQQVNVPGELQAHAVAMHPRPERWVAAGWKSPLAGRVRLAAVVRDAHAACGNGVRYRLEHRRGSRTSVLRAGDVNLGTAAEIQPIEDLPVAQGDLISLVIDARDRNHVCDLTHVDLQVNELAGEERSWSLVRDCADDITSGNPHADRHGNPQVWHFYAGAVESDESREVLPPDCVLVEWLEQSEEAKSREIAERVQALLTGAATGEISEANKMLRERLASLRGPLFRGLDRASLIGSVSLDQQEAGAEFGLDAGRFGSQADGSDTPDDSLVLRGTTVLECRVPASLLAGGEFVVTGLLDGASVPEAAAQLQVTADEPRNEHGLLPGLPIVARPDSPGAERLERAFEAFRQAFPAAMCHARIVPVDEVVTLVQFHREDEHLCRLMLDEAERAELDRLWEELRYVSREALTTVTAFEQLMEFATQDADPKVFEPLREPIQQRAEAFRRQLEETAPAHLDALVEFASRAYRRPLSEREASELRRFYHSLRTGGKSHEDASRLVLVRILTSPAFLYRLETPAAGSKPAPVSDWELAGRLSYFLWSSAPDEPLRKRAADGELHAAEVLRQETRRMLRDPRTRRLAVEFACQWLHLHGFDELDEKNEGRFPGFEALRGPMYEESIRFFTDLFQNDRSVVEILDADHTFLNRQLAEHYGIAGVDGDEWRRVEGVRALGRGGILAQASVLSKQAGASRTSPILRGNWLVETLLGRRLPRPPRDVPQLPETPPEDLTERQLIERHSSDPACATCHARIDPYGFALENYDAIGRFRDRDAAGRPIDARTVLPDGTRVEGLGGLRAYLVNGRRREFLDQFCRKLLGYALGRSVQLSDEPLLSTMRERLEADGYRFSVAVETIVTSDQFRNIRGRDHR